jgi:copper oxidase (laccase) domain-containing protein
MTKFIVALSKVEHGNMYIPSDTENIHVIENRKKWLQSVGISFNDTTRLSISYDQADFCRYDTLSEVNKGEGMIGTGIRPADALVVTTPGHALFLPVADCVATVFYDEVHSVCMLAHLGRHSLEQNGGVATVSYLVEQFGVNPATLKVWLSPAPNKQSYPIFALNNKGMKEVLLEQLSEAGITSDHITDNSADTITDPDYYSHTAFLNGKTDEDGRFAMVAMMVED